jgi:hypothetical protein
VLTGKQLQHFGGACCFHIQVCAVHEVSSGKNCITLPFLDCTDPEDEGQQDHIPEEMNFKSGSVIVNKFYFHKQNYCIYSYSKKWGFFVNIHHTNNNSHKNCVYHNYT